MRGKGRCSGPQNPRDDNDPKLVTILQSISDQTNSVLQSVNAQTQMMGQFTEMLQKLTELTQQTQTQITKLHEESTKEKESRVFRDFLKVQPLTFNGGLDVEEAENWVLEMEGTFRVIQYDEPTRVKLGSFMLKRDAKRWWHSIEKSEGEVTTWERFKKLFLDKYFPKCERDRRHEEFLHLEQGTRTVREYEAKFTKLARFARGSIPTENAKCYRFIQGLRPSIRVHITTAANLSYNAFISVAEGLERLQTEEAEGVSDQRAQCQQVRKQKKRMRTESYQGSLGPTPSYNCGEMGHKMRNCSNPPQ